MQIIDNDAVPLLQPTEPAHPGRQRRRRHQRRQVVRDAWWVPASAVHLLTQWLAVSAGVRGMAPVGARSPAPAPAPGGAGSLQHQLALAMGPSTFDLGLVAGQPAQLNVFNAPPSSDNPGTSATLALQPQGGPLRLTSSGLPHGGRRLEVLPAAAGTTEILGSNLAALAGNGVQSADLEGGLAAAVQLSGSIYAQPSATAGTATVAIDLTAPALAVVVDNSTACWRLSAQPSRSPSLAWVVPPGAGVQAPCAIAAPAPAASLPLAPSPSSLPSPRATTTTPLATGTTILGTAGGIAAQLDVLPPPDPDTLPFATTVVVDLVAEGSWSHRLGRLATKESGDLSLALRRAAPGLEVLGADVDAALAAGIDRQSLSLANLDFNLSATVSARAPTATTPGNLTLTLAGTQGLRLAVARTAWDWTFLVAAVAQESTLERT